ncbi:MAG: beta-ketoacyl-ACP reductase, partial [Bdellovibrionales bacterium]
DDGARVLFTYVARKESAEEVLKSLSGEGHQAFQLNVSDEKSVEILFKEILEKFGAIHGLVNNAGVTKDQLLLRMKLEDFDEVIQTNLRGAFLCTRSAVKAMLKQRLGSIVNITSVIGHTGNPGQANYAASKAGITAFSKSIAQEVGSRNIRVNCVAPGFITTEMTDILPDAQKNAILAKVPLQKFGKSEDVAAAVSFLLSEDAAYITGQTLHVNGGMA